MTALLARIRLWLTGDRNDVFATRRHEVGPFRKAPWWNYAATHYCAGTAFRELQLGPIVFYLRRPGVTTQPLVSVDRDPHWRGRRLPH